MELGEKMLTVTSQDYKSTPAYQVGHLRGVLREIYGDLAEALATTANDQIRIQIIRSVIRTIENTLMVTFGPK